LLTAVEQSRDFDAHAPTVRVLMKRTTRLSTDQDELLSVPFEGELLGALDVLGLADVESLLEIFESLELFDSLDVAAEPELPDSICFCGLARSVLVEPERLSVR
jgi:hypothetical protein